MEQNYLVELIPSEAEGSLGNIPRSFAAMKKYFKKIPRQLCCQVVYYFGEAAISPQYFAVGYFSDGLAWVRTVNYLFGLINERGEWLLSLSSMI